MAKSKYNRKTRSDKFPLTLHPTGQYCKKIKGKLYYFGNDKQKALKRYLEQAAFLHAGKTAKLTSANNNLSLKTLCNLYLDHQESRATIGETKLRNVYDLILLLRAFVKFVGATRAVTDVSTFELQNYRQKLIRGGLAPRTVNNHISAVKAMYHWAVENEIIDIAPNLKAIKKISGPKTERPTFTSEQIRKLLEHANDKIKAMIWLGLNCGFGCTDCSELRWEHLDFKNNRVDFPRTKTGIERNLPLWEETIKSLRVIPRINERVFNTRGGRKYVRVTQKRAKDGTVKLTNYDGISSEFSKLLKKARVKTKKGVGFYALRRTAATLTARSGDPFAVQRLLGHADLKMATTYVQNISEQTDRAINNSRKFIIQDDS